MADPERRYIEGYGDPRRVTVDDMIAVAVFLVAAITVMILALL